MDDDPQTEPLLTGQEAAKRVRLSYAAFYRAVADGRLPQPFYPTARAPPWLGSELDAAVKATRQMPAMAMAERRARKRALASKKRRRSIAAESPPAA